MLQGGKKRSGKAKCLWARFSWRVYAYVSRFNAWHWNSSVIQGTLVSLLTMHRCRNKSVILKCMCCHGCQPLRASTAVLGIELGGHRTYLCCIYCWGPLAPDFLKWYSVLLKCGWMVVDGKGKKISIMHRTAAHSMYSAQWWVPCLNRPLARMLLYICIFTVTAYLLL